MRKIKQNRQGQMRVIETILASFVIVFAMSFLNTIVISPPSEIYEVSDLEKLGYNVLYELDSQGILREFVYNESWESLATALRILLPANVYFSLDVYDVDGTLLNQGYPIAYGDRSVFSESKYIASVSYILPGTGSRYDPRVLELKLVRG